VEEILSDCPLGSRGVGHHKTHQARKERCANDHKKKYLGGPEGKKGGGSCMAVFQTEGERTENGKKSNNEKKGLASLKNRENQRKRNQRITIGRRRTAFPGKESLHAGQCQRQSGKQITFGPDRAPTLGKKRDKRGGKHPPYL